MRPFVHPPASSHWLRSSYLCPPTPSGGCVRFFATPWTAAHQASLSFTVSLSLLRLMSMELVMPSNHLVLCRPLLLPSVFPSIRVFSNVSALCIRWPKYWSFSFSISPSMNILGWLPLGLTGWISLQPKGLSIVFSNTTVRKHQLFEAQSSSGSNSQDCWKNHTFEYMNFVCKEKWLHPLVVYRKSRNSVCKYLPWRKYISLLLVTISWWPTQWRITLYHHLISSHCSSFLNSLTCLGKKKHIFYFILEVVLNLRESCKNKIVQKRSIYPLLR